MTKQSKALTPSELAAAQAIRSAYRALDAHPLKRWLPIRVKAIDGTERQMLVQQQKVNTDPNKESALHLLVIRPGRLLRGEDLQPLVSTFKLRGDNRVEPTGGPSPVKPDSEALKVWLAAGFSYEAPNPQARVSDFATVKAAAEAARVEYEQASMVLQRFPKGPMGLTLDAVKITPEWQAARAKFDKAFAAARCANAILRKHFPQQLQEERDRERERRMQAYRAQKASEAMAALTKYVVRSKSEDPDVPHGAFWSNELGWASLDAATRYSTAERMRFYLPMSAGLDAEWMLESEALDLVQQHEALECA